MGAVVQDVVDGKLQLLLELLVAGAGLCRSLELGEIEQREL